MLKIGNKVRWKVEYLSGRAKDFIINNRFGTRRCYGYEVIKHCIQGKIGLEVGGSSLVFMKNNYQAYLQYCE